MLRGGCSAISLVLDGRGVEEVVVGDRKDEFDAVWHGQVARRVGEDGHEWQEPLDGEAVGEQRHFDGGGHGGTYSRRGVRPRRS